MRAQASLAGPRLFPRGAQVPGIASTRFDASSTSYLFALRDLNGQTRVEYRLPLRHANMQRGMLRIEERTSGIVPMEAGGLSYRLAAPPAAGLGAVLSPTQLGNHATNTVSVVAHSLDPFSGLVRVRMRDSLVDAGVTYVTEKEYALRLVGMALEITANADPAVRIAADHNYAGFVFGPGASLPAPTQLVRVPYMDIVPIFAGGNPLVFCSRQMDWYMSNGSDTPAVLPSITGTGFEGETSSGYYKNDLGQLNAPIAETAYVIVSRDIHDLFPVVDRPPSEYRKLLAARSVSQCAPGVTYTAAKNWVDRARGLGIDEMQHIKWDWNKWPFNLNDPDFLDATAAVACGAIWGSGAEWLSYVNACGRGNWGFATYFEGGTADPGYPNLTLQLPGSIPGSVLLTSNPAYNAADCVRDAAFGLKKGWNTNQNLAGTNLAGQGHANDVLAPHLRPLILRPAVQQIHGPGGWVTGGVHIDAKTEVPAWIEIDQRAGSGFDHSIAETLQSRERWFRQMKDDMTGPLMGENSHWRYRAFETYAAGLVDGTSRKIQVNWSPSYGPPDATNWDLEVIPDYELGEVIPRATGMFGMGWEHHFKIAGYPVSQAWQDEWHTTLLSFGHAPFFSTNGDVPNNYWDWQGTVKSHYLLHGLSHALRAAPVSEIRYEDASGGEHALAVALALGLDLRHPRLVLRTAQGVEVKLNHSATMWQTSVLGVAWQIPMNGFVGAGPNGLLAFSAINPNSGVRADYAFTPGHSQLLDQRGTSQSYAGFPGPLLPVPSGLFHPPVADPQMVIVHDLREDRALYASGFQTATANRTATPVQITALRVDADDTTLLSLGRMRIGLCCTAMLSNGTERDVTGRVTWTSSSSSVAVSRLGGLLVQGVGPAAITAQLPGTQLTASKLVSVNLYPVLSAVETVGLTATEGLFRCTSDIGCFVSALVLQDLSTQQYLVAWGRADPAQKTLTFHAVGLQPQTSYAVFAAGANVFQLIGLSPTLQVTTP